MKISLIGSGNVATHLSIALMQAKHKIIDVYSRTLASAQELATRCDACATNRLEDVSRHSDIYIISVKDDAIADIVRNLCPERKHAIFVHTAGSVDISVFEGKAQHYGVLYPMQTFSKSRAVDLKSIPCYIEASDETTLQFLSDFAHTIFGNVRTLSSADRRYLHLSAVFACNFVNYCYDIAGSLVQRCGIPFTDLLPLIDETAAKVHQLSPHKAQTGPAVRFDENVIKHQLELLASNVDEAKVYKILTQGIHKTHVNE